MRGKAGRRGVIALVVLAAALAIGAAAWWLGAPAVPSDGPIVLISIDTLRADHLPNYGYRHIKTPVIAALADEGILFEHAYAHSPQTLPSHTSILSGKLPFEHAVRDNLGFTVPAGLRLLPQMLKERGYATGGVVSSYVLRAEVGINAGFDFFDSQLPVASPEMSIAQVQRGGLDTLAVAERWLDSLSSAKFFLFFHIYEPHKPYTPPERYGALAPYDGEIAYADEIVGKLIDSLRRRELYDAATIVLLSDHGEGLGDHGELEHGVFLYDESTRVPLIIKLPGGPSGGRRVAQPVQHIDLVPTVLDLAGAPRPAGLRGRSLRPLFPPSPFPPLMGEKGRERRPAIEEQGIYAEAMYPRYHFGWSELHSLTDRRYRYIKAPREELYDLEQDSGERTNIADERPQARAAMRAALERLLAGTRLDLPAQVTSEERERLQALGYVGMTVDVARPTGDEVLPDPKDKVHVLEKYRRAVDVAGQRQFAPAIALFGEILAENPTMADVWQQLGNLQVRAGRYADSVASFKRLVALKPSDPTVLLSVAGSLLRLRQHDEARAHAELALSVAGDQDRRARAGAHELLARLALARKDGTAARRHAELAREADPTLPLPSYVQALIFHQEGRYAEALPLFAETLRQLASRTVTLTEVHFYTADTLARLGRNKEAEAEFLREIQLFPHNARARANLAMLYQSERRDADVKRTIDAILRSAPTPEGYGLAARLWTMFGEPTRAAALREQARRQFAGDPALADLDKVSLPVIDRQ